MSVLLEEETKLSKENITDLSQITDRLYRKMLYQLYTYTRRQWGEIETCIFNSDLGNNR